MNQAPCGCKYRQLDWVNMCSMHAVEYAERHERAAADYRARSDEIERELARLERLKKLGLA